MTVGIVMTVWNNKHAHRRNLLGTVVTMPTVITLSPTLPESSLNFNYSITYRVQIKAGMRQRTPQQSCAERVGPHDRCKPVKYCRQQLAGNLQRHLNFHHHSLTL